MPCCPRCGSETAASAKFCPNCGTSLVRAEPKPEVVDCTGAVESVGAIAPTRAPQPITSTDGLPLPENICGMLAYFFIPAIAFLFVDPFKRNRFVRFHSAQCLLTVGVLLILHVVLAIFARFEPILALPLYGLLVLAELTLWLLLLLKAYQHVVFKLPYIGELAENWAGR